MIDTNSENDRLGRGGFGVGDRTHKPGPKLAEPENLEPRNQKLKPETALLN